MNFKPNIVVLITEDLSPHAPTLGDPLSPMKTVDEIASDSLVFENAFCAAPVCAPSRFSMITGLEPASCGPAQQMRADGILPLDFPVITTPLLEAGYYCINVGKADYNFNADMKKIWNDHSITADWSNRSEGQPFFAIFNLVETHESSIFQETVTVVNPADVNVPPYLPDLPEIREDLAKYYSAMNKSEQHMRQILDRLIVENLIEDTAIIVVSDHGGSEPRSKRFVYDSGSRVPLLLKLPQSMKKTSIWREPERITTAVSLIDLAPTVCALAGVVKPSTMTGKSLLQTNQSDSEVMVFNGRDRMDENYDLVRTARTSRYLYIRNYMPNRPWLQHQAYAWQAAGYQAWERSYLAGETNEIQSQYFKAKPAEEFYDTKADPHQVNNLIDSPALESVINEFRKKLDERTLGIVDNGFIPEGSRAEGIINSRDPELYPLARVLQLANLAITRNPENGPHFIAQLKDQNEVIRFWAAQGLLYLGMKATDFESEILEHISDPSDHVRISIAETLAIVGQRKISLDIFSQMMVETKPFQVLIRATRAISSVQEPMTDLLPQIESLTSKLRGPEFDSPGYFNAYTGIRYLEELLAGRYEPGVVVFDLELFLARLRKSNPDMVASMARK